MTEINISDHYIITKVNNFACGDKWPDQSSATMLTTVYREYLIHQAETCQRELKVGATFFVMVLMEIHYIYLSSQHSSLVLLSSDIKSVYIDNI